jgi:hypothetical protein
MRVAARFFGKSDRSDLQTIVSEGRKFPDGLAVDAATGHLYWTNMNDRKAGTVQFCARPVGRNIMTIMPPGAHLRPAAAARYTERNCTGRTGKACA